MRGSNERRTALAALALGVIATTGAAAAAPVDVLRATNGASACVIPLGSGGSFTYRYIQSIYEVPVVEDLAIDGDRIRILRIRSAERRAVEYYRWETPITRDGQGFVQEAPPYATDRLVIRVSPPYAQRLDGAGGSCDLQDRFPGDIVTVEPAVRPAVMLLR